MEIRKLHSIEDYEKCVVLQRAVWGFSDRDLLPARYMKVTHMHGGSVLGAFEPPDRLIAFAFAQPSIHEGRLALHSNILAVRPEFQNRGIGALLKLEQRKEALARGIALMTWTYDPLQARNAYLNLNKLGAIARTYLQDVYGSASSSSLHSGLGTDRVLAEWWMDSPRVRAILEQGPLAGDIPEGNEDSLPPCVLRAGDFNNGHDGLSVGSKDLTSPSLSLEIPSVLTDLMASSMQLARQWRSASREMLMHYFSRGYQMTRLVRTSSPSPALSFRTFYILEACETRSD